MGKIADIRKDYKQKSFSEENAKADAIQQFSVWWQDAVNSTIDEVNACTLATCSKDGKPSARIVLLKGFDERGFTFFTNYNSRKGKELNNNPYACIVFFWKELERQIRIEGPIKITAEKDSDTYFLSRPEASRIGAWASPQSSVINNRNVIEENVKKYEAQFASSTIVRPPHWGGYILSPNVIEFWQGRPNRLHDRLRYSLQLNNVWKIERLAP